TEAAPVPMSRVVGVGGRFVGLTPGGELFAWEEGRGFRALPEPAARFVDVAADPRGRLLALAVPEALFASDDGGAAFGPAAGAARTGGRRIGVPGAGRLAAQGIYESIVLDPAGGPPKRTREAVLASPVDAELEVGRAPSATAVAKGLAVLDGERYVE